jgi:hypothetical protein
METPNQTFAQFLSSLRVLHAAMVIGLILFLAIVHFVLQPDPTVFNGPNPALLVNIAAGLLIICSSVGYWVFGQRLKMLHTTADLNQKLLDYRSASIIKFALIEGPTLASIVFYLLSGNIVLVGIAGVGIVVMAINHPTAMKVKMDLELSDEI